MVNRTSQNAPASASKTIRSKPLAPHRSDAYRERAKAGGSTRCPECGAVYQEGRWRWLPKAKAAHEQRCPACQRIHDHQPAGYLSLSGAFLAEHERDVLALIARVEEAERKEHPLQRVMEVEKTPSGGMTVTTTDHHLARRLTEAMHASFQGSVEYHYGPDENFLRATWAR